jgi:hypothetical protein
MAHKITSLSSGEKLELVAVGAAVVLRRWLQAGCTLCPAHSTLLLLLLLLLLPAQLPHLLYCCCTAAVLLLYCCHITLAQ